MSNFDLPRPIINEKRPNSPKEDFLRQGQSRAALWSQLFRKISSNYNTRYVLLWLTGGLLFTFYLKPAIRQREKDLTFDELDEFMKKRKEKNES